ncbi:MAG: response regulator transcription factor [Chthoniobacterales bacterium]|nr:response regulator transcription factor [Chthoniobacterales bacterium]
MKQTTILIIDDHQMMRDALSTIISQQKDLKVVGQASDGREGAEKAAKLKPDVVTLDIAMPNLNGLDAARHIRRRSASTRIILLSAYEDDLFIQHALEAGVDGFVSKKSAADVLAGAVRQVAAGMKAFSPAVKKRLEQYEKTEGGRKLMRRKTDTLTEREIEVLQLVAEGNANKQMADKLGISMKTVEKHRQSAMNKLHIHDTAGLTRYAISAGLVENPSQLTMHPVLTGGIAPSKSKTAKS